jgi:hypothetical protein
MGEIAIGILKLIGMMLVGWFFIIKPMVWFLRKCDINDHR